MRDSCRYGTSIVLSLLVCTLLLSPSDVGATSPRLDPLSFTFLSGTRGYVLSLFDCATHTCAAMRSTSDGARTWSAVPVPSELNADLRFASWGSYGAGYPTLSVHFADARNGWIYGGIPAPYAANPSLQVVVNHLWSTHDAGRTWRQLSLNSLGVSGGVTQMASHGPLTYLFGSSASSGNARILTTSSSLDRWTGRSRTPLTTPAGGTQLEASFSFAGSSGWFVAGNDRGFSSGAQLSSDGTWREWRAPSTDLIGASYTPICAVTDRILLAVDAASGFVTPPASSVPPGWNGGASWLFISYDSGATFKPLRELSSSYRVVYPHVSGLPAAPVPGTILLEQVSSTGTRLVRSTDWGRSWRVVVNETVTHVAFTSRSNGFAISQSANRVRTTLLHTNTAGSRWVAVAM